MLWKEGGGEKAIDWHLGAAAHKRRKQDGHLAVALRRQGAAGHDRRHAAAEADEKRHDAATGQADLAQELVHDEGDTSHVAAVLEQREKEKQRDDDRQEAQHGADAAEDTVAHEGHEYGADAAGFHDADDKARKPADEGLQEPLQPSADNVEGEIKDRAHDDDEGRQCCKAAGEDVVELATAGMFLALMRLDDGFAANTEDEIEAHVGDGGGTVQAALSLHLTDDVFDGLLLVLVELERCFDAAVAFDELRRHKAHRYIRPLHVVFDEMHQSVDASVHGTAVLIVLTEIVAPRFFLIASNVDSVVDELGDALVFRRRDRHNRHAKLLLQSVDVDGATIGVDLVHHVQRHNHRNAQLQELHRQVEVALNVGGVHNVDDAAGLFLQQELPRHNLFAGVRRHGIDSRQVGDEGVGVTADDAVLAVHCDTREVADVLIGAGELVEKGGLATVLVADEGKSQRLLFRQRRFRLLIVVDATFAETRMLSQRRARRCFVGVQQRRIDRFYLNVLGVGQAQRQFVAMHSELHRVAKRRQLHQLHIGTRDEPHIQKMLTQLVLATNGNNLHRFADFQLA